jgi:hypothetical protein
MHWTAAIEVARRILQFLELASPEPAPSLEAASQ